MLKIQAESDRRSGAEEMPHFLEPEAVVLCSPDGATDPLPDESNSDSHTLCLRFEIVTVVTGTISVLWLVMLLLSIQSTLYNLNS